MSRAGKKRERSYWGCTTFGCDIGFNGTEEALPEDLEVCPECGAALSTITVGPNPLPGLPSGPVAPQVPPEVAEHVQAQFRANRLFALCHSHVVSRDPALWDGVSMGAAIAEHWMQTVIARMERARSGLVVPAA
jgi:hypothetical protein